MHIPDGYLGPTTCGFFYAVMAPIWFRASRAVRKTLKAKQVPYLAFSACFVFVIMLFNIPIPGGSTGHAIGGTLAAILLGPWLALIAVTVAVAVQAVIFGDGGITAFGANCFNMAFVLPFAGYYVYKLVGLGSKKDSMRKAIAAAVGAYFGMFAAALFTGLELGAQPMLYSTAQGKPLYCPYAFNVAVPMMLVDHLLVFGWIEAIVTFLVIRYLQQEGSGLIR